MPIHHRLRWKLIGAMAGLLLAGLPVLAETERQQTLDAMLVRPGDLWPRGIDHVVYAIPGSREVEKGYEEPGGSLSPAVGSFGIAIWVLDIKSGLPMRSSDTLPLTSVRQQWLWPSAKARLPELIVSTPDYHAKWSLLSSGDYSLTLQPSSGTTLAIAVRSVGPAGGPIQHLEWSQHSIVINERWQLRASHTAALLAMGHEGETGWLRQRNTQTRWHGRDGWGYALVGVPAGVSHFRIRPVHPLTNPQLRFSSTRAPIELALGDARFEQSLQAQVATLMMGLVGTETRPGEPTNYPLPWLRDGAYTVVALARAGQLSVAKQLTSYFARHDFFGGFGPEADAPGLALWALGEVSQLSGGSEFAQENWSDIRRKAEIIVQMRHTSVPVYRDTFGPIVPAHLGDRDLRLVCEPARNGLIIGRMDWGRPLLFVNAVSFSGLMEAARMARLLEHTEEAARWTEEAEEIQQAWTRAFATAEHENERTFISTLWPTWVGAPTAAAFRTLLDREWNKTHRSDGAYRSRPLWTYFDIAEAHQWLWLGDETRVWQTLDWFWNHQSAPGLFTWWEGSGEENSFGRWQNVRGWVQPKDVTPHYWTASEMLLLQLDMLAYVDRSSATPSLVLGAGIPESWLAQPMRAGPLQTELGPVNWSWDGHQVVATLSAAQISVREAGAFASLPVRVQVAPHSSP